MHLKELFAQPGLVGIAGKTAGDHEAAAAVRLHGRIDPAGDPRALIRIGYFVQAVEQEKQVAAGHQLLTESFGRSQVGLVQLGLDKGVQALIQVAQLS